MGPVGPVPIRLAGLEPREGRRRQEAPPAHRIDAARLERDVVFGRFGASGRCLVEGRRWTAEVVSGSAAASGGAAAAAAIAAGKEHHPAYGVGDDLRGVLLGAFLVGPLAGLKAALDEDLAALGEVLSAVLRRLAPDDDAVPLGPLLLLACLVRPRLVGGDGEVRHRLPAGRVPDLGITAQIADQDDLVDAARHACLASG